MLRTGAQRLLRAPLAAGGASSSSASLRSHGAHTAAAFKATRPLLHPLQLDDEFTKEPHYPPIQELSFKANLLRKRAAWHEHIRGLPTVEEKLLALNMPRYYGYKCLMLTDDRFRYDCLPLVQHSTRTLFEEGALPAAVYDALRAPAEQFVATIRDDVQSAIVFETIGYQ